MSYRFHSNSRLLTLCTIKVMQAIVTGTSRLCSVFVCASFKVCFSNDQKKGQIVWCFCRFLDTQLFHPALNQPVGSFDIFKVLCFCGFFLSRPSHCQKLDDCVACFFGQLTLGNESFAALHKSSFIKVGLSVESKT